VLRTIITFIGILVLWQMCTSCQTAGTALVSDLGNGSAGYQAIQGDIRKSEADLAITGTKIEEGIRQLEQSISGGPGATLVQGLKQEAASLNNQLAEARDLQRASEQSFNEYEAEKSAQLALKNGVIADLNRSLSEQTLETERYKGVAGTRLIIIIALGAAGTIFVVFKVWHFFRGKK